MLITYYNVLQRIFVTFVIMWVNMTPREFVIKHSVLKHWAPGVSYVSPFIIDTKLGTNISCMTWLCRHNLCHVKTAKIVKHRQNQGFRRFCDLNVY